MYSFSHIIVFYHIYHGMIYLNNVFIFPYYCALTMYSFSHIIVFYHIYHGMM